VITYDNLNLFIFKLGIDKYNFNYNEDQFGKELKEKLDGLSKLFEASNQQFDKSDNMSDSKTYIPYIKLDVPKRDSLNKIKNFTNDWMIGEFK
jgi:hypothetical protein